MVAADKENQETDVNASEVESTNENQPMDKERKIPDKGKSSAEVGAKFSADMDFLLDVPLEISVELGRTKMLINELLKLGQGSVVELSKLAGETLEILANQKLVARGEVVVVNEKYGVRLTEIISPTERIERLK